MGGGTPGGVLDREKRMTAKFVVHETAAASQVYTYVRGSLVKFVYNDGALSSTSRKEPAVAFAKKGCRPGILARTRLRPQCAARGHSPRPAKR